MTAVKSEVILEWIRNGRSKVIVLFIRYTKKAFYTQDAEYDFALKAVLWKKRYFSVHGWAVHCNKGKKISSKPFIFVDGKSLSHHEQTVISISFSKKFYSIIRVFCSSLAIRSRYDSSKF
jgi:hypothetical protein